MRGAQRLGALLVLVGCAGTEAEVVEAPNKYKACNTVVLCDPGLECRGGVCLPPLAPPTPVDGVADATSSPTDAAPGTDATAGTDAPTPPSDVGAPTDVAAEPHQDTAAPPIDGSAPPADIAPAADECTAPGQPSGCPFEPALTYCRFEPSTKSLACQTGATRVFGEPCDTNLQCDLPYGCHFGKCTTYCELFVKACPANTTCTELGHPGWGACKHDL